VVTVLDPEPTELARFRGVDPEDPMAADSEATRRECLAMLKAERDAEEARARTRAKPSARAREVMHASVAKAGSEETRGTGTMALRTWTPP
jgi:hypothetical protein